MLNNQQSAKIKEQLLENLKFFPENQQELIKKKILSLSSDELEKFLKENNLSKQECIFCSIISGKISSYKINENPENLAVLEINPLSKGHSLIIPKKHSDKIQKSSRELSQEVVNQLAKLNPRQFKIKQNNIMGHQIMEIIPVYDSPLERKQISQEELKKLQQILKLDSKKIKEEKKEIIVPVLPERIP